VLNSWCYDGTDRSQGKGEEGEAVDSGHGIVIGGLLANSTQTMKCSLCYNVTKIQLLDNRIQEISVNPVLTIMSKRHSMLFMVASF
jgi:hypothetical protein